MEKVQNECRKSIVVVVANETKRTRDEENDVNGFTQAEKKRKIDDEDQIIGKQIDKSGTISIIENTSSDNEADDPLQLDDLNNDCLRHIFEFLSMYDLIKVAQSAGQFGFAAAEAFSRRYRKLRFEVTVTSEADYQWYRFAYLRMNGAVAMAGLQYFGARMSTLTANFSAHQFNVPAQRHAIDVAILKKCQDSLQAFEVHFCIESHFEMIEKPFAKVQKLMVNGCTLGVKFGHLNKWFPNLVSLRIAGVKLMQPIAIETHFEHLTALKIVNDEDASIPEHTIRKMLQLNRQLKTLKLHCDYCAETLVTIKDNLMALETLELWIPTDRFASYTAEQKVSLSTLKTLILHAKPEAKAARREFAVERMPFVLTNVNDLRLYGFNQYHPLIVELIESGDQLKTINLIPFEKQQWHSLNDYEAFKQVLLTRRHLNELELCVDGFVDDDLVRFIGQCKHANALRLISTSMTAFESLSFTNDDWLMSGFSVNVKLTENHAFGLHSQIFYHTSINRNK